jgi:cytochrome c biogenesis protein CcdA
MTALLLAFLAGALTVVNPCVLPLLPVMIAVAFMSGRLGPLALGAGLVTSFTIAGIAIGATGNLLGFGEPELRAIAAVLFVLAGIVLLVPVIEKRLTAAFAPAGATGAALADRASAYGLAGQFGVGLLAGVIWTPCSGPAIGAAFALAAQAGGVPAAALRMAVFGLGAASVLALLALGSRALIARRRLALAKAARGAKPIAGALFLVVGLAVLTGLDKRIEAELLDYAPSWLITLTTSV